MSRRIYSSNIIKIYLSNFLTGLVFWYGIEKIFMQSIGINAIGIGIVGAFFVFFTLAFDFPFGILADRWSRKGLLAISTIALAICSVVAGTSHSLNMYLISTIFYGIYIVCTSGTYQALTFDVLREEHRSNNYSKIMGRAYALFLLGCSVANIASGFIAHFGGLALPFFVSTVPCLINFILILGIREPIFHKAGDKQKLGPQIYKSFKLIFGLALFRSLAFIFTAQAVVDVFKLEFSQLYMLTFTKSTIIIGVFYAAYSLATALGSYIAHHVKAKLNSLIVLSLLLLIVMGLTTSIWGVALFMVQSVLSSAIENLIETRIQNKTSSTIRTSVMSALTTIGRLAALPVNIFFGWLILSHNVFWALRFIGVFAALILVYWLVIGRIRLGSSDLEAITPPPETYIEKL